MFRVIAKCSEDDKYQVERDLLREYRLMLVENGIDVSFPQVVVNYAPKDEKYDVSNLEKRRANRFAKTQKALSEGLDETNEND